MPEIFLRIWKIRKFTLTMVFMIFRANFGLFTIDTEIQEFSLSMISAWKIGDIGVSHFPKWYFPKLAI